MTQYLILLELTQQDIHYSIDGLRQKLGELMDCEWQFDKNTFDAEILSMLQGGIIEMSQGTLKLGNSGKSFLRNSKLIAFVQDRMNTLFKQSREKGA